MDSTINLFKYLHENAQLRSKYFVLYELMRLNYVFTRLDVTPSRDIILFPMYFGAPNAIIESGVLKGANAQELWNNVREQVYDLIRDIYANCKQEY